MQSPAALSDSGSVYRAIVRVAYQDLLSCLYRLRSLIAEAGPTAVADLTARRLSHVRAFVNALGQERDVEVQPQGRLMQLRPARPATLSTSVYGACTHTLDRIEQEARTNPATACDCAIQLLDVIAREVEWLARA